MQTHTHTHTPKLTTPLTISHKEVMSAGPRFPSEVQDPIPSIARSTCEAAPLPAAVRGTRVGGGSQVMNW